jgi:tRNA (cytidine56-2'-O)-methyltransferase
VGNQPHSEVAALAITLDRLQAASGKDALRTHFSDAKCEIIPHKAGKEVKDTGKTYIQDPCHQVNLC